MGTPSQGKVAQPAAGPLWRRAALFSLVYYLAAEFGHVVSLPHHGLVSLWLPAAVYLAGLSLNPIRNWPWIVLAAFPADAAFDLLHGRPLIPAFFFFIADTIQALFAAFLIRRFVSERPTLGKLTEYTRVLGIGVLGAGVGAVFGAAVVDALGWSNSFFATFLRWWSGNSMAIVILLPVILSWLSPLKREWRLWQRKNFLLESVMLAVTGTVFSYDIVRFQGILSPYKVWLIPWLLWAGLRFELRGASVAAFWSAALTEYATNHYLTGLTASQIASGDYVFVLQSVGAMIGLIGCVPAIALGERDQTLARLRDSEERFRNLAEASFEGVCISQNGVILDANDQFLALFGYPRDETIGREIVSLITPEYRSAIAERLRTREGKIVEHLLLRKDGSTFMGEAQARMLATGGGGGIRITAVRDVTDRKEAERALRESEEKFSTAFRTSPDIMSITDFDTGVYLEVNQAHEKMFGFTREEVLGRSPTELGIYRSPSSREAMRERLRQQGSFSDVEIHALTKNGRDLVLLHSGEMITLGGRQCVLRVSHNITDRKRAEQALRESEQRFRNYFEMAVVGCAITSLDREIVAVNDKLCEMIGYTREELQRMTWTEVTHPDDRAEDERQLGRLLRGESDSYIVDKRYMRKDARVIYVTVGARCVRHADGSPDFFVGMAQDITARREATLTAQRAREQFTRQLIASQEAQRRRIAGELHDSLGQNLLLVKNHAQRALTLPGLSPENVRQLEEIRNLTANAIAEVRQISQELRPSQLDHLGLTRALQTLVEKAGESSGILVKHKIEMVDEVFDPDMATNLFRIVQESLNNILKHSGAHQASVRLERDVHELHLVIEDDGHGFDTSAPVQSDGGFGLKNLAERARILGGALVIVSGKDKGTRLEIIIPIAETAPEAA